MTSEHTGAAMSHLNTETGFADPDSAYRALIDAHRGLTDEDSAVLNTRLVLILASHIGDRKVLDEAIALAASLQGGAA